jgi:hypothetical protein
MFEVGKTYETKYNGELECIAVTETHAWMRSGDKSTAYVWTQEGKSVSLGSEYDIKPKPREYWLFDGIAYPSLYKHANAIHVREVLE